MACSNEKYMRKALRLARRGVGSVEPNPAVGCVIVKNDRIIGEGWHRKYGGPHAEINALEDCQSKGSNPRGATLYVTLEPCCHQGKTPACTDAIIKAGISEVVVAMVDPSKHADGRGIEILRDSGIEVRTGVCGREAKELNAPFIKFAVTGSTWVIVKWAQSIDGKLAYTEDIDERWISGEQSRRDAHKLRRRVQGILVGIGTVLTDAPLLTPRPSRGRKPLRIVLDSNLRIPVDCRLLSTTGKGPVWVVTTKRAMREKAEVVQKIIEKEAEVVGVAEKNGRCDLKGVLAKLSEFGMQQLLVEGGPRVIRAFIEEGLIDEFCIYIAPLILGKAGGADMLISGGGLFDGSDLKNVNIRRFGDDVRITGLSVAGATRIEL